MTVPQGTVQALPASQGNLLRMPSLIALLQDQEITWPSLVGVVTRKPPRILGKGRQIVMKINGGVSGKEEKNEEKNDIITTHEPFLAIHSTKHYLTSNVPPRD